MPRLLTTQSAIQCPHGGSARLTTANTRVQVDGGFVLLENDQHVVTGCPFMAGSKPQPCIRIQWSAGAQKLKINGQAALTESSVGLCSTAEQITQGKAIVVNTQSKGSAL